MERRNIISIETYERLVRSKKDGKWAGIQSDRKCSLGKSKTFSVKDSDKKIDLRCYQIGGSWTGEYCYCI